MFSINNFSIQRLNNAEFTGFFINLQKAIEQNEAEKLGVDGMMTTFNETLQKLVDQVYNTTGSAYTAAMIAADERRVAIFRRIRLRLQTVLYAESNETLLACKDTVQYHLLGKYPSKVAQSAYHGKTAIIQGFLLDLRTKLDGEALAALGIAGDIENLEAVNNEFIEAYNSRATERSEGDTGLTASLRVDMNELYQQICVTTQYFANLSDEANAEKAAACQAFIGALNIILSDAKKRLAQRQNGETTTEEGDATDSGSTSSTDSGSSNSGSASSGSSNSGSSSSSSTSGSGSSSSNSGSSTEGPSEEGNVHDGIAEY